MTAQIPDQVLLDGARHILVGVDGVGLFDPREVGIEPRDLGSACWRGFFVDYGFDSSLFQLDTLSIGIAGVDGAGTIAAAPDLRGVRPTWQTGFFQRVVYDNVCLPIDFSGRLLLAAEPAGVRGLNMGFPAAWRFETVRDVHVEDGRLQRIVDVSHQMREIREGIIAGVRPDPDGEPGSEGWVERTFSQTYDRAFGVSPQE